MNNKLIMSGFSVNGTHDITFAYGNVWFSAQISTAELEDMRNCIDLMIEGEDNE